MVITYFRKTKAPFRCLKQFVCNLKPEYSRIGQQGSDSWIRLTQKRKSEVNYIYNVCIYYYFATLIYTKTISHLRLGDHKIIFTLLLGSSMNIGLYSPRLR